MSKRRPLRASEIHRILVLQIGPIGDTIFTIPALKALRQNFPSATIVVLASARAADVLRGLPYLDLLRVSRSGLDLIRAVIEFRQSGFDLALGLSNQGSWLAGFCGTPFKAGFPAPLLYLSEPGPVKEEPSSHVVEYCLSVIRMLGGAVPEDRRLELPLTQAELDRAACFMNMHHLDTPVVAIHPGGRYFPLKRWPVDRFARLAEILMGRGLGVVVVGGPEDSELASLMDKQMRARAVTVVGKMRIRETAALLARCQLFVGNDSAPLHMAAAVNTPSIGLFGPTSPAQYSPYGTGHVVICKSLPCSPCFRFLGGLGQYLPRCTRPQCMEAIGVDEVASAVLARLGMSQAGHSSGEGLRH
ncbi:MAG: glycosyltransferase family 9 protein [Bacteroidota bacterium]